MGTRKADRFWSAHAPAPLSSGVSESGTAVPRSKALRAPGGAAFYGSPSCASVVPRFEVQSSRFKVQGSRSSPEPEEAKTAGSGHPPARSNLVSLEHGGRGKFFYLVIFTDIHRYSPILAGAETQAFWRRRTVWRRTQRGKPQPNGIQRKGTKTQRRKELAHKLQTRLPCPRGFAPLRPGDNIIEWMSCRSWKILARMSDIDILKCKGRKGR
jgi:hypothetical protein